MVHNLLQVLCLNFEQRLSFKMVVRYLKQFITSWGVLIISDLHDRCLKIFLRKP